MAGASFLTIRNDRHDPVARELFHEQIKQAFRDAVLRSIGPGNLEEMLPTMISLVSGLAAQRRIVGRAHDDYGDSDMRQCEEISRAVAPGGERELLAHAQGQADRIVAEHWHEIEAVAAELLLHRRLDAAQITDIVKTASLGPAARRRRAWERQTASAQQAFALAVRR